MAKKAKKKKKKSAKRRKINPARFSLKALHAAFNQVEKDLKGLPRTGSLDRMKQDLKNAGAMLVCPQAMLRDLTRA
jgi:hypothetical protein